MTTWDWFDEYEWHVRLAGDADRVRMSQLHRQAYLYRESDPDQALMLLRQGKVLADKLQEAWWSLYYDQQYVHALLHFKQDFRDVLDRAVRNTLELRKPIHAEFPRRLMIHGDLVSAYLGIDPVGHAEAIERALSYLDQQTPSEGDERYLLLGSQRQFALELGDLDTAEACCQRSLDLAAADPDAQRADHFLVFTYSGLAEVAWRRGDLDRLAAAAQGGLETAEKVGHQVEVAGFGLWKAVLARAAGDAGHAARLYRKARTKLDRLGMQPDPSYRDAECAYHERAGDLDLALAVRDAELAALQDRGQWANECSCLLKRAALLRRLGRLTAAEVARVRRAAGRLQKPQSALAALEGIERGAES